MSLRPTGRSMMPWIIRGFCNTSVQLLSSRVMEDGLTRTLMVRVIGAYSGMNFWNLASLLFLIRVLITVRTMLVWLVQPVRALGLPSPQLSESHHESLVWSVCCHHDSWLPLVPGSFTSAHPLKFFTTPWYGLYHDGMTCTTDCT